MNDTILGCEILEDEILHAKALAHNEDPIEWLDSSLHMFPAKLQAKLQEHIDRLDREGETENILLSFGYCGNAIIGLRSERSNIIVPKANDCIEIFFWRDEDKQKKRSQGCYFLTRGWMKNKNNIVSEYERYLEKYGEVRTARIMDAMLAHYHYLTMIDTKCYPVDEFTEIAEDAAKKLNLSLNHIDGSITLLQKLFEKQWDDDFLVIEPGITITMDHFEEMDLNLSQGQIG